MFNFIAQKLQVHEGERLTVAILFLHYFLVSAAVIAGKSARDAFFLSRFDKSDLPLMYLANAVVVAGAMAVFSRLSKKLSPGAGVAATLGFFSVSLFLISLKLDGWMIGVLYVWMEVIGAVAVLQAWILTGNAFDPRQAKRLFGVIAAGGSIAAWAGGSSISWFVTRFGSSPLISVVAGALALSIFTGFFGSKRQAPRPKARPAPKQTTSGRLKLNPYLVSIATLIAAASIVSAVIQYRFQVATATAYPTRDEMVAFFGQFYAWTGAASLASQLFLSSFLLSRFGVVAGLFVLPASFTVGSIFTLLSPSLWSAGFGRFSDLTFKFTVNNSSIEMLWLPVPPEERLSAKPAISGTLKAVSEAATAILMFALVKFTPAWVLSAFAIGVCGVWIVTVLRLKAHYRRALASVVEKRQLSADSLRLSENDPAVVEALDRSLRSSDESEQMAALGFLDGFPLAPWSDTLREAYAGGSPEIKERILSVSAAHREVIPDDFILSTIRNNEVKASQAVHVAVNRKIPGALALLDSLLDGDDFRNGLAAASAIIEGGFGDQSKALACFERWLSADNPAAVAEALRLLTPRSGLAGNARLESSLNSPSPAVRKAALEAVANLDQQHLIPEVIACLPDPRCGLHAKLALQRLPAERVVEALLESVSGNGDGRRRRAALRALRDYPAIAPEDRAIAHTSPRDIPTYLEFAKLLLAIRAVRPVKPGIAERIGQDSGAIRVGAYVADGLQAQLSRDPDGILVQDHAAHRFEQAVETALRLTVMDQPEFPVNACLHALDSRDPALLPYVLELLDATLSGEDKRVLSPLIDVSQAEKRMELLRTLVPAQDLSIESQLGRAASSPDTWEAVVAADYLSRKGIQPEAGSSVPETVNRRRIEMLSILEKTIILKSSDLFGSIPAENLSKLASIAVETTFASGATIFKDGDDGDALYLVASGSVSIAKDGTGIAVLGRGSCFGEMAVLDKLPRSADAVVADEAVLLRIGADDFYDVLAENPELTQAIVGLLTRRLRQANARIAQAEC